MERTVAVAYYMLKFQLKRRALILLLVFFFLTRQYLSNLNIR